MDLHLKNPESATAETKHCHTAAHMAVVVRSMCLKSRIYKDLHIDSHIKYRKCSKDNCLLKHSKLIEIPCSSGRFLRHPVRRDLAHIWTHTLQWSPLARGMCPLTFAQAYTTCLRVWFCVHLRVHAFPCVCGACCNLFFFFLSGEANAEVPRGFFTLLWLMHVKLTAVFFKATTSNFPLDF